MAIQVFAHQKAGALHKTYSRWVFKYSSSHVHFISAAGLQFVDNNWVFSSTMMFLVLLPLCAHAFCSCWSTSINFKSLHSGFILDLGPSQDAKVIVL